MKHKKKFILLILTLIIFIFHMSVDALESDSYVNQNGVILTQKEYDFVKEFYGENYFEKMTMDDYEWIQDLNVNTREVEIQTLYDYGNGLTRTTFHETSNKKITIAKTCSSICTIITSVIWYTNPAVRSYDVIGARFVNTELASESITTKVTSSSGTTSWSNIKNTGNGIGVSVKLPSGDTNISLSQKFYVYPGGYVFASYQHAIKNVTLATSLSYYITSGGYGGVFNFYGDAVGCYDQMGGVYITT